MIRSRPDDPMAFPAPPPENYRLDVYLVDGRAVDATVNGESVFPTWFKLRVQGDRRGLREDQGTEALKQARRYDRHSQRAARRRSVLVARWALETVDLMRQERSESNRRAVLQIGTYSLKSDR